ncbi:MAG TPA: hypothetical protein VKQ36_12950, partial [Ktedonobacterales bacterium]|nr:hypothetical protein [Ktedonobacterales bacterium]
MNPTASDPGAAIARAQTPSPSAAPGAPDAARPTNTSTAKDQPTTRAANQRRQPTRKATANTGSETQAATGSNTPKSTNTARQTGQPKQAREKQSKTVAQAGED